MRCGAAAAAGTVRSRPRRVPLARARSETFQVAVSHRDGMASNAGPPDYESDNDDDGGGDCDSDGDDGDDYDGYDPDTDDDDDNDSDNDDDDGDDYDNDDDDHGYDGAYDYDTDDDDDGAATADADDGKCAASQTAGRPRPRVAPPSRLSGGLAVRHG